MEILFFIIILIQTVLPVQNKKHSSASKCPSSTSASHHIYQEENASFILVSKFNKTVSTYELNDKFRKPLRTIKGMLLHSAVSENKLEIVRGLLILGAEPNVGNRNGVTPLYEALEKDESKIVEVLMACGANPNFSVTNISLLLMAVLRGDPDVARNLIRLGARVDWTDNGGKTPLYYAAELNRTAILSMLLESGADVNHQTETGKTLLHIAVSEMRLNTIKALVELGIKIDVMDHRGRTPLYIAIVNKNSEIESFLIEKGADINFVSSNCTSLLHTAVAESNSYMIDRIFQLNGNLSIFNAYSLTPLYLAVINNNTKILEHLFNNYINVNLVSSKSKSYPIHFAIEKGTKSSVKTLLDLGALKTVKNKMGLNPLVQSILLNKSDITELLISNKQSASLDVNYNVDRNSNKPLHLAVLKGDISSVAKLLDYGANPNATNKKGLTPLCLAVEKDNTEMIRLLASRFGDLRYKHLERGDMLLHIAVRNKALKAAEELLDLGLNVDSANNRGVTPLFKAVMLNDTEMIKLLASKDANLNMTLVNGDRPILTAISNSTLRTIITLIELGAEIEPKNALSSIERAVKINRPDVMMVLVSKGIALIKRKRSLLHLAAEEESIDIIKALIRLGVPVDNKYQHKTPLWTATSNNKLESMKVLLEKGADIASTSFHPFSAQGEDSGLPTWTLIHETVFHDLYNATALLLDHGMDPNVRDYRGWTPLHYAAVSDKLHLAQLLVDRGADVSARSRNGITPLDLVSYSKDTGKLPIIRVLKEALAKIPAEHNSQAHEKHITLDKPPPFYPG